MNVPCGALDDAMNVPCGAARGVSNVLDYCSDVGSSDLFA